MAMERGAFADARDLAIQGSAANRGSGELLLARARADRALGNPTMAIRLARLVLTESPDNVEARDLLVEVAAEVRDVEALEEARRRLEEEEDDGVGQEEQKEVFCLTRNLPHVSLPQPHRDKTRVKGLSYTQSLPSREN